MAIGDPLEILFGSKARTRILRYLLQHPEDEITCAGLVKKTLQSSATVRKEINLLKKIGFLKMIGNDKSNIYVINQDFPYFSELHALFLKSSLYPHSQSLSKVKSVGDVKLAFISGAFLNHPKAKADLVIVADNVSRIRLKNMIRGVEAELGKEIKFVLLSYEEFRYRLDMLDRFVTEFFSGPYEEIFNRIPDLQRLMNTLRR